MMMITSKLSRPNNEAMKSNFSSSLAMPRSCVIAENVRLVSIAASAKRQQKQERSSAINRRLLLGSASCSSLLPVELQFSTPSAFSASLSARSCVSEGMSKFRRNDVAGSIQEFDRYALCYAPVCVQYH
jgi:hypothetical protein